VNEQVAHHELRRRIEYAIAGIPVLEQRNECCDIGSPIANEFVRPQRNVDVCHDFSPESHSVVEVEVVQPGLAGGSAAIGCDHPVAIGASHAAHPILIVGQQKYFPCGVNRL
jgi:hypothetical protein